LPRGDQSKHAARSNENGMVARRAGENGLSDELSARAPRGPSLFREGDREGLPPNLNIPGDQQRVNESTYNMLPSLTRGLLFEKSGMLRHVWWGGLVSEEKRQQVRERSSSLWTF
jgi:hypothetical protein